MMTKNYLFASMTSALLLFLVVPLLSTPYWITGKVVSIAALSLFSISVGGLVAETFEIVTGRSSYPRSQRNARRYFMSVLTSALLLAIVAPSITAAIDSNDLVSAASASALLGLSLGIGGLTTNGFFALFSKASKPTENHDAKGRTEQDTTSEKNVVDVLLGKAKLGGK